MWKLQVPVGLLLLFLASSIEALSYFCPEVTTPLGDLLSHDVAVRIWVGNAIVKSRFDDPFFSFMEEHYYPGKVMKFFKGDYDEGRIIVRTNLLCGLRLQNRTQYLMFGSIREEQVPGFIGKMPVLVVGGNGMGTSNRVFEKVSRQAIRQLWAYKKWGPRCMDSDCPQDFAFPKSNATCPDKISDAALSKKCSYNNQSNQCQWNVKMQLQCPVCETDADCSYGNELHCGTDGVCVAK